MCETLSNGITVGPLYRDRPTTKYLLMCMGLTQAYPSSYKYENAPYYIVPLTIHRGYYIRVKAIHHVLTEFLHYFADHDVQVS